MVFLNQPIQWVPLGEVEGFAFKEQLYKIMQKKSMENC